MKQKTEIEIELSETVAYSRRSERFETFCLQCKSMVEMAPPQIAAIMTHTTERGIYRLIETGKIHFVETGRVLVCLRSLTRALSEPFVVVGTPFFKNHERTDSEIQLAMDEGLTTPHC
jgi:hypothetical protein